ncbi:Isoniazid inductible gene protein IniC [Mycobacteroides abscessus]|nr:Isoniazid inductible gene protein IniC [Mycobacteroides abscessus]
MSSVVQARVIISDAMRAYQNDSRYLRVAEPHDELRRIAARLDEPIRVAIAGTLNAGKSTLVNALVGEDIAPTDATEATRIVAWFRHGAAPRVTANLFSGVRQDIPIRREGGLSFELDRLDPASVADLDVNWPAPELNEITLIDTPGTSSLSTDVSERSLALLVPEDGVPRVDAVIFLLRSLNAADIGLLTQIGKLVGGERGGAVGVVGVVSRADEIGVGRLDAMLSAREVAARFAGEMERTGICQAVVPVAGLLALTRVPCGRRNLSRCRDLPNWTRRCWPRRCYRWTGLCVKMIRCLSTHRPGPRCCTDSGCLASASQWPS